MNRRVSRSKFGSRRDFLALMAVAPLMVPAIARAQDRVESSELGELPTSGGIRPGPVGFEPAKLQKVGIAPVTIKIEKAQVDAQIEEQKIVDGVMQDPSGPWVVAWYPSTAGLGEGSNVVMAGHLDYWDVGEAVFYNVWKLEEGDQIEVTGQDEQTYIYAVDWVRNYKVAELDAKGVQEIVGKTDSEKLTLITCGGPFDYDKGEYTERIVIRSSIVV